MWLFKLAQIKKYLIFFILVITSSSVYFNSLSNNFVLDDKDLIIENAYIKNPKLLPNIFISDIYRFSSEKQSNYYRPMQNLTYALDYSIWKLKPFGYHLTNIILHSINCYLIYVFIVMLFTSQRLAFLASVLYSVSPIHTSIVAYISGRADILVSIFMFLSIIKFLNWRNTREIKQYIMSIILFSLALFSRENALLLPLLLILIIILTNRIFKNNTRDVLFSIIGFFVLDFFYIITRTYIIKNFGWLQNLNYPFAFTVINIINVLQRYFTLLIFPWSLYPMRTIPFIKSLTIFDIIFILSLFSSIIILIFKDKKKIISFSFFWFILMLSPISKLIYHFPSIGVSMAENWLYMPSIGFFVIVSYFLCHYKKLQKILFFCIFFFYSSLTIANNKNWKDDLTLYKHILKFSPNNNIAKVNLANVYFEQGLYNESLSEFKAVLIKEPMAWDVFLQIGNVYLAQDNINNALECYQKAIMINPKCSQAYHNLGIVYERQGKGKESFDSFTKALEIDPEYFKSYLALGDWFMKRNLYKDAIGVYKKALELKPADENVYSKIGISFAQMGHYQEALSVFQKSLNLRPNSIEIMKNIGAVYGNMSEFDKAIKIWKKVLELNPNDEETKINIQKTIELQSYLKK